MKRMEAPRTGLAQRVFELRQQRGFERQKDLADAAGVQQSSVSDIERGVTTEQKVRASTLVGLSRALTVTWEYLLNGAEEDQAREFEEAELIAIYRQVPERSRQAILQSARTVLAAMPPTETSSQGTLQRSEAEQKRKAAQRAATKHTTRKHAS
jgi:transcriptional regulator with XRE-family HTH domain